MFYAEWCGACKAFMPHWKEFKDKHGERFEIAEMDGDKNRDKVTEHGIRGFPTVVVEKDGKKRMKAGAVPMAALVSFVDD